MKERPILFSGPMVRAILDGRKTQTRRIVKPQPAAWATVFRPAPIAMPCGSYGRAGEWIQSSADDIHVHGMGCCPYGQPGDRLWVKETHGVTFEPIECGQRIYSNNSGTIRYRADYSPLGDVLGPAPEKWRPSIFMRREYSRITLEITGVRCERLQDISEADAVAEGVAEAYTVGTYQVTGDRFTVEVVEGFVGGIPKAGDDWQGQRVQHVMHRPPVLLDTARDSCRKLWESINGLGSWAANPWVWVIEFRKS